MDFCDDVYHAIGKYDGLSQKQIAKIQKFKNECEGPIMVAGAYFDKNNADHKSSREYSWTEYNVYETQDYIFVEYSTRIQGDSDFVVRLDKDKYTKLDIVIEEIQDGKYNCIWRGHKIY